MDTPQNLTLIIRDGRQENSLASEIRRYILRRPLGVTVSGDEVRVEINALPPDDPQAIGWKTYRGKPGDNCAGCKHPVFKHYALEGPCMVDGCGCAAVEHSISAASEQTEDGNQD